MESNRIGIFNKSTASGLPEMNDESTTLEASLPVPSSTEAVKTSCPFLPSTEFDEFKNCRIAYARGLWSKMPFQAFRLDVL